MSKYNCCWYTSHSAAQPLTLHYLLTTAHITRATRAISTQRHASIVDRNFDMWPASRHHVPTIGPGCWLQAAKPLALYLPLRHRAARFRLDSDASPPLLRPFGSSLAVCPVGSSEGMPPALAINVRKTLLLNAMS